MRAVFIILFSLLSTNFVFCQFKGYENKSVTVDVFGGFIYRHKPQIEHLITDHSKGFRLSFDRKTYGKESWEYLYNYPDVGMTFVYLDYGDRRIGKSIGLMPHFNLYLTKREEAKSRFTFKVAFGVGFNTEIYDPEKNNKNNVLSTPISAGMIQQFGHHFRLNDKISIRTSLSFTHFSNGSIKKPNSGINVIAAHTGLSYIFNYKPTEYHKPEVAPLEEHGLGYTLTLRTGIHEATKIGAGSYPFLVLSGMVNKRMNHKLALGLGLDFFYSESLRRDVIYDDELVGKSKPDFKRIGINLGQEFIFNNVSIMGQIGYYIYDPYEAFNRVYLRAGPRIYLNKRLHTSVMVKSHGAKAEALEFGIGYRIK